MYHFVYYMNMLTTTFLTIFRRFSDHFPKIFEESPKFVQWPIERLRTISENCRRLPKISEQSDDSGLKSELHTNAQCSKYMMLSIYLARLVYLQLLQWSKTFEDAWRNTAYFVSFEFPKLKKRGQQRQNNIMNTSRCKLSHYWKPVISKIGDEMYCCCFCYATYLLVWL